MSTIVTRSGKGSTLSWAEADANFTNLNTDKTEVSAFNTHVADTATHGTTGDIVGTSDAQVLTNKTINTASNTITVNTSDVTGLDDTLNTTSIANLRLIDGTGNNPTKVFVDGYYTAGDGGGGEFYWDATSTAADNNGTIIKATAITTGRWVRLYSGPINIKWFGAVGDGVTDDRTPFVNAIAYLGTIGGGELLAEEDYKFTFGFNINQDNVTVNGNGTGRFYFDGTATEGLRVIGANNVTLKNLSSFIPRTNNRTGFYINCWVANSTYVTVENCTIDGGVAGIWFFACDHCDAIGNTVDTPKADGIHFSDGSTYCRALNNTVKDAGDDGIATTTDTGLVTTANIVISGNIITGLIWGAGIAIRETNDVVISNNVMKEIALAGIRCHSDAGDPRCENVTIVNNTMLGVSRAEAFPYSYWDGGVDVPITADTNKVGVLLGGTNIRFSDNIIRDVESSPSLNTRIGIGITECNGLVISDNTLSEVTDIGIKTVDSGQTSLTIKNNSISADGTAINLTNAVLGHFTISENVQLAGSSSLYLIDITNTGQIPAFINNNTSMDGKLIIDGSNNLLASYSGNIPEISLTYTPTVTNIINATAVNPSNFYFMKTGSIMNVYGTLVVTTAVPATDIEFSLSLPRASNFTVLNDAWGNIASAVAGSLNTTSSVYANIGADILNVKLRATSAAATTYNFNSSYIVK